MIIPPPTPVPSVTITIFFCPRPPPFHISPSAATFASFPTFTLIPVNSSSSCFTSLYSHPRFAVPLTIPSSDTGAGTPTPIPKTASFGIACSSNFSATEYATSGRIADPLFSVLVLISHLSTVSPSNLKIPIFTVVPPISTPKQ
ncbi:unknown [[Clostridium] nexile CAG:348]|nr:unknown [[Clostridium] nexile CAG:348]